MNRKDLPAPNAECVICGHKYYRCKRCIELKMQGVEIWRLHCDSYECAMIDTLLKEDPAKITKEQYEMVANIELPDGRKMKSDVKAKVKELGEKFKVKEEKASNKNDNVKKNDEDKYTKSYAWNNNSKKDIK